jgi:hypothetical protein
MRKTMALGGLLALACGGDGRKPGDWRIRDGGKDLNLRTDNDFLLDFTCDGGRQLMTVYGVDTLFMEDCELFYGFDGADLHRIGCAASGRILEADAGAIVSEMDQHQALHLEWNGWQEEHASASFDVSKSAEAAAAFRKACGH